MVISVLASTPPSCDTFKVKQPSFFGSHKATKSDWIFKSKDVSSLCNAVACTINLCFEDFSFKLSAT